MDKFVLACVWVCVHVHLLPLLAPSLMNNNLKIKLYVGTVLTKSKGTVSVKAP